MKVIGPIGSIPLPIQMVFHASDQVVGILARVAVIHSIEVRHVLLQNNRFLNLL